MNEQASRLLASFGRQRGRKLRTGQQHLLDASLPRLCLNLDAPIDLYALFPNQQEYWLEIGFGGGEHLAAQALRHPEIGVIGCEPFMNGVVSLLRHLRDNPADNVRLHQGDARHVIALLPPQSLQRVFLLFPDPWPKARHHKRRIVNQEFLESLHRVMKPGAELRMATDHSDYASWMLEHLLASPHFEWIADKPEDWRIPPSDWVQTRYETKALQQGIKPVYLRLRRVG